MSSRLLTIEGVYDGRSIQPLETIKTDRKHRVLITFLAEKDKEFVFQVTDEVRDGLHRAGVTEEEILEDFNKFRRNLAREQATFND